MCVLLKTQPVCRAVCFMFALQVTSTGSLTAPWCTYGGDGCEPFNSTYQQACAEGLCRAAGFASGTYVPGPLDPQDWCTPKLGSGQRYS